MTDSDSLSFNNRARNVALDSYKRVFDKKSVSTHGVIIHRVGLTQRGLICGFLWYIPCQSRDPVFELFYLNLEFELFYLNLEILCFELFYF